MARIYEDITKTIGNTPLVFISEILILERNKEMKYKNVFVTTIMILFCFGLPVGLGHTSIYGDGDHHDHSNHGGDGDMHGNMSKTGIRGVVSSISGSTISIQRNHLK